MNAAAFAGLSQRLPRCRYRFLGSPMSIITVATILEAGPLAAEALRNYRRLDKAKTLNRLVLAELENDESLNGELTESLKSEWLSAHEDGLVAAILAGLLDRGGPVYLEALKERLAEVIADSGTLPVSEDAAVTRLVAAVNNNHVAAQKDAIEATQRSTTTMLERSDALEENLKSHIDQAAQARPARVVVFANDVDPDLQRRIAALNQADEVGAGHIATAVKSGGIEALAPIAKVPPSWAAERGPDFWRTVGRLLASKGMYPAAQAAFEHEANCPAVVDRVEALMAAARSAEIDGRPTDADTFVETAKQINAEHPSVALFEADREGDPAASLELVEAVAPTSPEQGVRRELMRSTCLLRLGRYGDAKKAAELSFNADPHAGGRELTGLALILLARENLPARDEDDRPLIEATEYQWSLHEGLLEAGRFALAATAGARAAVGYAVLGDWSKARETIDAVKGLDGGELPVDARSLLLDAAIVMGDSERAKPLLGSVADPVERVVAEALVDLSDGGDAAAIVESLDEVLADLPAGEQRVRAIRIRLTAAARAELPVDADLISEVPDSERLKAELDAGAAVANKDFEAAALALAPYDDVAALAYRVDIAEEAGNISGAVGLQRALVRKHRTARSVLRLAQLRAHVGDHAGAIDEAVRLASDERKSISARDTGYSLACQVAVDASDWEKLEDLTQRWMALVPDDRSAQFARTLALARVGRHKDARDYAQSVGLEPAQFGNQHRLFAELCLFGYEDKWEGLRALIELSDRFGRPQELELALISGVMGTPEDERDDDEVIPRFQEALETFEERFPDSDAMRKISVDENESAEHLLDKIVAAQPKTTREQQDAFDEFYDGVRLGALPVAFLAALAGRGTVDTIMRNGARPMAIFDQELHDAELKAAEAALEGAAATWDETACMTSAELSEASSKRIAAALPGSTVGQSVRDSLVGKVRSRPAGKQAGTIHVGVDGNVRIYEEDEAFVDRVRTTEDGAAALAEIWDAHPDSQDNERKIAALIGGEDRPGPVRAFASAIMAAQDLGVPLYSDDRVVRALAREEGVHAFGTITLIDAMQRGGLLDRTTTESILHEVIDLGIWGLLLAPTSYVAAARRAGFSLQRCYQPLLGDEVAMRADPRFLHNAALLASVAAEAPQELDAWATAIVSTYAKVFEVDSHAAAAVLLAQLLDPNKAGTDDAARQLVMTVAAALTAAVGTEAGEEGGDLLVGAFRRWLSVAKDGNRGEILTNLINQVPESEAARLQATFDDDEAESDAAPGADQN